MHSNQVSAVSVGTANSSESGHHKSYSTRILASKSRRNSEAIDLFDNTASRMPAKASWESRHFRSQEARPASKERVFSIRASSVSDLPSPIGSVLVSPTSSTMSCKFDSSSSTCFLSSSTFASICSSLLHVLMYS